MSKGEKAATGGYATLAALAAIGLVLVNRDGFTITRKENR